MTDQTQKTGEAIVDAISQAPVQGAEAMIYYLMFGLMGLIAFGLFVWWKKKPARNSNPEMQTHMQLDAELVNLIRKSAYAFETIAKSLEKILDNQNKLDKEVGIMNEKFSKENEQIISTLGHIEGKIGKIPDEIKDAVETVKQYIDMIGE